MVDGIDMVRDAIGLKGITMEDSGIEISAPSSLGDIKIEEGTFYGNGGSFVSLVDIDFMEYRKKER